ncbi:hypothetical protein BASA81_010014 [Batrachochytrium salamandrivorans]|nr:hypothetical protein BASA81_010014 [Batrachochytrium salamandrivorans]
MPAANAGLFGKASMLLLSQQANSSPVLKRPIFWVFSLAFLAYFTACLAMAVVFFSAQPGQYPEYQTRYNSQTAPPTSWGVDGEGKPCPFNGCTSAPAMLVLTKSPTVA